MTEGKAREFWLDIATPYGDTCDFIHNKDPYIRAKRLNTEPCVAATNIHVIEKAAYDELQKENEQLKIDLLDRTEKYKLLMDSGLDAKCIEVKQLKSAYDKLLAASNSLVEEIKHAAKYLESCGHDNVNQRGEPEYEMLKSFNKAIEKFKQEISQ